MITVISFVVVIGIIILFHELGHFFAAKISGVRVEEFSIGFPPKMIGKKIGETEYQLAWIPLGGYVKMSGMLDESFDDEYDPDDPRGFVAQSLIKKIFIITAGVIMNFLLAFFIYTGVTWYSGVGKIAGTTLTIVSDGSPAAEAGIMMGDSIVAVNGIRVKDWDELTDLIRSAPGVQVSIDWFRNDSLFNAMITPEPTPELNVETMQTDTVGKLGILGSFITEPVGPLTAVKYGASELWMVLDLNVKSIKALVTGKASIKQLAGPIGIAKMSGETARAGFVSFLLFIGLISASIGFLNILPIPMLDGGHLVFIIIEAIIRRPISEKLKINIMKVGLAALLLLITIVSYHDILRLFKK